MNEYVYSRSTLFRWCRSPPCKHLFRYSLILFIFQEEEEEEEEEENDSGGTCAFSPCPDDDGDNDGGGWAFEPAEDDAGSDEGGETIGAGTGAPITKTVIATATAEVTVRVPVTSTVLIPASPTAKPLVPQPPPEPQPPAPLPDTEAPRCWLTSSYRVSPKTMSDKISDFCEFAEGRWLDSSDIRKTQTAIIDTRSSKYYSRVGVLVKNGCLFQIESATC